MSIVFGMIGVAVVMVLIGSGLDVLFRKLSKNESKQNDVTKTEDDKQ